MKKRFIILTAGILLAVGIVVFFVKRIPEPQMAKSDSDHMELITITDPVIVFKKAFWRTPGINDKVLHALRLEWAEKGRDISAWQWFISVKPSPELVQWLKTNPFSLLTSNQPFQYKAEAPQPKWFPNEFEGFEMRYAPQGRLVILFSEDKKLLYAMDSGSGFTDPARNRSHQ